ncbi:protein GVQW3 [Trichonephila clavipes]|nr:protein GVQW3 [Trichonephila clavipes]
MSDAEIIATVTVNEKMSENDEDFEDIVQTPEISQSEERKAVETFFQYFEQQSALVMDLMFLRRFHDEAGCNDETAFGEEAISRAWVFEWFRPFKEGCQSVNSDPRSGRPFTSRNEDKIAQVKAVESSDRRLTVREIAQECHISVGSCDKILRKDLNMRRVSAKFVPRLLTEDQQFQRLATLFPKIKNTLKGHRFQGI